MDMATKIDLLWKVTCGVAYLHDLRAIDGRSHDFVHRDVKPENLLLADRSEGALVKLCDFGLASFGLSASATHTSASGKPVLVGTTEYMAPEVVRQMACGQAIDAWALGVHKR